MTTLQQTKILIEDQIAFKKDTIAKKKQLFDQLEGSAANEMQLEIEALIVEQWQDEAALKAVNEEISRIPTLAYQKILTTIVAVFICLSAFCQDTIPARMVKISDRVWVNAQGKIVAHSIPHWTEVKSGFIVKKSDNLYIIDGKEYKPGDHKKLKIKR